MSLQGTLDTFSLPDVLAMLASTKKRGEVLVTHNAFRGSLWMDEGKLVGAEVPRCPSLVDALFELLRLTDGAFVFDAESPVRVPMSAQALGDVMGDAEERMIEWRDIAIVVPHVNLRLKLVPAAPSSQVVLDSDQWRLVVASAVGASLADLSEALQMGEFEICRTAKHLVENGLATTADMPASAPKAAPAPVKPAVPAPSTQPPPPGPAPVKQAAPAPTAEARPAVSAPTVKEEQPQPDAKQPEPAPANPPAATAKPAAETPRQPTPAELLDGDTDESAEKPGEPVDRSALLKFLSSVRN